MSTDPDLFAFRRWRSPPGRVRLRRCLLLLGTLVGFSLIVTLVHCLGSGFRNRPPSAPARPAAVGPSVREAFYVNEIEALATQFENPHHRQIWRLAARLGFADYCFSGSNEPIATARDVDKLTAGAVHASPSQPGPFDIEWRLTAHSYGHTGPRSFLKLQADNVYNLDVRVGAAVEWRTRTGPLFDEQLEAESLRLLECLHAFWAADQGDGHDPACAADVTVTARDVSDLPTGDWRQYHLELERRIGDYLLHIELRDTTADSDGPWCRIVLSWTCLTEQ